MAMPKPATALPFLLSFALWTTASAEPSVDPPAASPTTAPAAPTTLPAALPATAPAAAAPHRPTTSPTTQPSTRNSTRPSAEVESLIRRLSADDWRDRQKAEDRLVQLGEDAVPALREAALEASGAEQRTRVESALARIEQIAANGPTPITLHLKDVNPKEVVAELSKQSGAPIKVWPEGMWDHNPGGLAGAIFGHKPRVSIDVDKQPFWLAVAEFCQKMNLRPEEMGYNQGITLMQGGASSLNGPRYVSGRFVITATGAQRQRWVHYGPPLARQSSDSLSLQVYVDPRARVLAYNSDPDVIEAVDDKGSSLGTHKGALQGLRETDQRPFTFGLTVPLQYPDDGYTRLSRLKGSFAVLLATRFETLEIADIEKAANAPKTIAGRTVELKQVKVTQQGFNYHLQLRRAGLPLDRWHNMFNEIQAIRITDADGHAFSGGGGGRLNDNDADIECSFNAGINIKRPLKLVWEMTTETKQDSVRFEFKDLPLPTP